MTTSARRRCCGCWSATPHSRSCGQPPARSWSGWPGLARHGWPERFADRVAQALGSEQFRPRDYLARAKADTIRLTVAQLLAIGGQRRVWERRMGQLLLGAPRHHRDGRAKQPRADSRGQAVPGGEIYLSFPGLGDRLAARVAREIGDHPEQFTSPNALACYAGRAPVTRQSGKSQFTVARRLAYNHHLGDACQQWAFCGLSTSGWAREFYDAHTANGNGGHHAALRALGNRWLEVRWPAAPPCPGPAGTRGSRAGAAGSAGTRSALDARGAGP